jgi:carboxymethylenebutenolidase
VKRLAQFGLAFLVLMSSSLFARPALVSLQTAASEPFAGYVDGPSRARSGVVLVHDWFGVSPFYTQAAARLAKQGYRVLAVDLYGGRQAKTHDEAAMLLGSLQDDLAAREIDAAVAWLSEGGRPVVMMGFSMGAKHALAASLRNRSVRATVLWYGETINDSERLKPLNGPALLIAGSRDGEAAAENAAAFSRAADKAGVGAEIYVYPGADHAFAQPLFNAGKTFDPVAAQVAWDLTESFLKRRLPH